MEEIIKIFNFMFVRGLLWDIDNSLCSRREEDTSENLIQTLRLSFPDITKGWRGEEGCRRK